MKKNTIILTAAALLVLAGCNKGLDNSPRAITIQAGIGTMTKVEYTGDKAKFVDGDKISVYAWTGSATAVPASLVVDGVVNTYDGSKWTPASQMLWDDKSSKHYFLGISPERSVTDFKADAYTLNPADFAASDLLIATNVTGLEPSLTPVELGFSHALARLDVNLTFRSQWDVAPSVTSVKATAKKTATVDYLAKALTATGTAEAVALTASDNASWSGLQVPQTGVTTITITIDGKDYVFTNASDIPLVGGKYTTVNLAVGRDKIELSDAITISDWTSQGAALEGDALEQELPKINGHAYVDLGLSVKWATCNVGAENPEDYGDYFAWEETAPKADYSWDTYFDTSDGGDTFAKYTTGKKTVLEADNDAATVNWGGSWRMPTDAEFEELLALENHWVENYNGSGINGYTFTGNGNTIFLPAAGLRDDSNLLNAGSYGYYWSSSLNTGNPSGAWYVSFYSDSVNRSSSFRFDGFSVRPVSE